MSGIEYYKSRVEALEKQVKALKKEIGQLNGKIAQMTIEQRAPNRDLARQHKAALEERDRAEIRERTAAAEAARWRKAAETAQALLRSLGHDVVEVG